MDFDRKSAEGFHLYIIEIKAGGNGSAPPGKTAWIAKWEDFAHDRMAWRSLDVPVGSSGEELGHESHGIGEDRSAVDGTGCTGPGARRG